MINRERGDVAKKTNVAVIGLGWPGREHLKGYLANDKAKVVAVCGFFDPLHYGHVDYLQKAKALANQQSDGT